MAPEQGESQDDRGPGSFSELLEWIIQRTGEPAIKQKITDDTLRNWRAGRYPKDRISPALREVDKWARDTLGSQYPPPGVPPGGLIALAQLNRAQPERVTSIAEQVPADGVTEGSTHTVGAMSASWEAYATSATMPATASARERRGHRSRSRGISALGALAVVLLTAVLIAMSLRKPPEAAPSSVLYARDDAPVAVHECPATACAAMTLPSGTKVKMICFRDAEVVDLNYSSERWFDIIEAKSALRGWVHSSQVSRQTRVGLC